MITKYDKGIEQFKYEKNYNSFDFSFTKQIIQRALTEVYKIMTHEKAGKGNDGSCFF